MFRVLLLYGNPIDKLSFDRHFAESHRRFLATIPNVEAVQVSRVAGSVTGESPFHIVAELSFASEKALQDGLNSEIGQTMARDFAGFASGGVTILLCTSLDEQTGLDAAPN
jgi:uncharacterized protein (TIGR02118 family)